MKKFMAALLGLSLLTGVVALGAGQDKEGEKKETKRKKMKKKKKDSAPKEDKQ